MAYTLTEPNSPKIKEEIEKYKNLWKLNKIANLAHSMM